MKSFMVIDLPENCQECPLNQVNVFEDDDKYCKALENYPQTLDDKRLNYCPLIPIEGS